MFEGFLFRFLALHFYVLALCLKVFVIKKSYLFKYYFYRSLFGKVAKKVGGVNIVNCKPINMKEYGKEKRNKKKSRPTVYKDNNYPKQQQQQQQQQQTNKRKKLP